MLRTKLIKLACITVLAMGISSQVSADPIPSASYTAVDTGDPSGTIFEFFFSLSLTGDGSIFAIDVFLPVFNILSFSSLLDSSPAPQDPIPNWSADLFGFSGDFNLAYMAFDEFGLDDLFAPVGMNLNFIADLGDSGLLPSQIGVLFTGFTDDFEFFDLEINPTGDPVGNTEDGPPVDVPEPGTLSLLGLGLLSIGAAMRRRRKI